MLALKMSTQSRSVSYSHTRIKSKTGRGNSVIDPLGNYVIVDSPNRALMSKWPPGRKCRFIAPWLASRPTGIAPGRVTRPPRRWRRRTSRELAAVKPEASVIPSPIAT